MSEALGLLAVLIAGGALILQYTQNKREHARFREEQDTRAAQRAEREQVERQKNEERFHELESTVQQILSAVDNNKQLSALEKRNIEERLREGDEKLRRIEGLTVDMALLQQQNAQIISTLKELKEQREVGFVEAITKLIDHTNRSNVR